MKKTKIEWCDSTWNPVTGCLHGCEYCYARKIANRFGGAAEVDGKNIKAVKSGSYGGCFEVLQKTASPYPEGFMPTLHRYRLDDYVNKSGRTIFVCSMADLFGDWVPDKWIEEVFTACEKAPQHRYLFLTKNPQRYLELYKGKKLPYKENFWFGTTCTKPNDEFVWFEDTPYKSFVSIEPILEPFGRLSKGRLPQWVIIGAETGNRKDKVVPKPEWIEEIVAECDENSVPVFMKDSLVPIIGEENMRREFPWEKENTR